MGKKKGTSRKGLPERRVVELAALAEKERAAGEEVQFANGRTYRVESIDWREGTAVLVHVPKVVEG